MTDADARIRQGLAALDPLPPGAEGDWHDVLGRVERPRHRRRWALAVAAVTAVAAAVIAVPALLPSGTGGPGNAAAALDRLANLVAAHSLTPEPGQYLYVAQEEENGAYIGSPIGSCETLAPERRKIWIGTDGSGLIRETSGPGRFSSAADRALCRRMVRTYGKGGARSLRFALARHTSSDWYAPRCLSLNPNNKLAWTDLSSDPRVLLQQIMPANNGLPPSPKDEFSMIETYLHETDAPPEVRATLLRAVALIPGVKLLGTVRDHAGRPGIGFSLSHGELIFDPETGELLGENGIVNSWIVYLRQKVVDQLPGKPPVPFGPPCSPQGQGVSHDVPGGSVTNGAPLKSK
jgi:hypothetical protein